VDWADHSQARQVDGKDYLFLWLRGWHCLGLLADQGL